MSPTLIRRPGKGKEQRDCQIKAPHYSESILWPQEEEDKEEELARVWAVSWGHRWANSFSFSVFTEETGLDAAPGGLCRKNELRLSRKYCEGCKKKCFQRLI